jgi:hypothetical protein
MGVGESIIRRGRVPDDTLRRDARPSRCVAGRLRLEFREACDEESKKSERVFHGVDVFIASHRTAFSTTRSGSACL